MGSLHTSELAGYISAPFALGITQTGRNIGF